MKIKTKLEREENGALKKCRCVPFVRSFVWKIIVKKGGKNFTLKALRQRFVLTSCFPPPSMISSTSSTDISMNFICVIFHSLFAPRLLLILKKWKKSDTRKKLFIASSFVPSTTLPRISFCCCLFHFFSPRPTGNGYGGIGGERREKV